MRSIVSFRLFDDGNAMGALNFQAEKAGTFTDESVEVGLVFAAHTSMAWNSMRREQQFQSALASRDIIGQAKGILMERFDIDAVAAFEILRHLSQQSNKKLAEIAERLIALEHPPEKKSPGRPLSCNLLLRSALREARSSSPSVRTKGVGRGPQPG